MRVKEGKRESDRAKRTRESQRERGESKRLERIRENERER